MELPPRAVTIAAAICTVRSLLHQVRQHAHRDEISHDPRLNAARGRRGF